MQRHYFANKAPSSQGYGFSSSRVWMWELSYKESWVPKNWCFWTVVLEKTLERVPWTARRSNQSILKEISPGCSLERLMLNLKLHYFGHLMWRTNSFEKTLMLGKIEGRRRGGRQRMRWLDGISDLMDMGLGTPAANDGQGGLACCSSWGRKESDMTETEQLNWTYLFPPVLLKLKLQVFRDLVSHAALSPQDPDTAGTQFLYKLVRGWRKCFRLEAAAYNTGKCAVGAQRTFLAPNDRI